MTLTDQNYATSRWVDGTPGLVVALAVSQPCSSFICVRWLDYAVVFRNAARARSRGGIALIGMLARRGIYVASFLAVALVIVQFVFLGAEAATNSTGIFAMLLLSIAAMVAVAIVAVAVLSFRR